MVLPVPTPRTFAVGEVENASYLNAGRDSLTFLLNPPLLGVTQTTVQSVANNTWTAINMDVTVVDSYGMHSNVTNNTRATAVVAGYYLPFGAACFATNGTNVRGARFAKNGTAIQGTAQILLSLTANTTVVQAVPQPVFLNVGDYVEVQGLQISGGALNTSVAADVDSSLSLHFLHV